MTIWTAWITRKCCVCSSATPGMRMCPPTLPSPSRGEGFSRERSPCFPLPLDGGGSPCFPLPLDGGGSPCFPLPLDGGGSPYFPLPLDGGGSGWGCLGARSRHHDVPCAMSASSRTRRQRSSTVSANA